MFNHCLLKVPIFASLDATMLEEISNLIVQKTYTSHEVICHEDEWLPFLGVLHSGVIKLRSINEKGKEHILSILYPGEYFGEEGLLETKHSKVDIIAISEVTICAIPYESLRRLMKQNVEMMESMMNSLLIKLSERNDSMKRYNLEDASLRVLKSLTHFMDEEGIVNLPITKKDLALSLGLTPETMSRIIKKLIEQNKIKKVNS